MNISVYRDRHFMRQDWAAKIEAGPSAVWAYSRWPALALVKALISFVTYKLFGVIWF